MKIWKKALSATMSAALLASLLGTAFAATAFAAQSARFTCDVAYTATATKCEQFADGASIVTIGGVPFGTAQAAGSKLEVTSDGVAMAKTGGLGAWVISNSGKTATLTFNANDVAAADDLTLVAPVVAGTTTLTVTGYTAPDTSTGQVTPISYGTFTITWISASLLDLDGTASMIAVTSSTTCAAPAGNNVNTATDLITGGSATAGARGCVWVLLTTGNGDPAPLLSTSDKIQVTLSPYGTLAGFQSYNLAGPLAAANVTINGGSTVYAAYGVVINATGVTGTSNINATVTYKGKSYTLAPKTFSFFGDLTTITLTGGAALAWGGTTVGSAVNAEPLRFTGKDAGGNTVTFTGTWAQSPAAAAASPALTFSDADADGKYDVACAADPGLGQGPVTYTVKVRNTASVTSSTITSNEVTVYCGVKAAKTVTLTATSTSLAAGGTTSISVKAVDAAGLPVKDGSAVSALAGAGGVSVPEGTVNGATSFSFVAPNNNGPVTVWAFVDGVGGSITMNIGGAAPGTSTCTVTSALGISHSSAYSATTKIAALTNYITFKIDCGAAAAGKTVGILVANKNASGVWSSFNRVSGRVADASGIAWYHWRGNSTQWLSIRGDLDGALSAAAQGRWR